MTAAIFRCACVVFLAACGVTTPQRTSDPSVFLTDTAASRYSAPELIRRYVADREGAAVYLSSRECPSENARADSLLSALLSLPPSGERSVDYALSWSKLLLLCRDPRVAAWYRDALSKPHDDLTIELLTKNLLRTREPLNIAVVKKAAFDTTNSADARSTLLSLYAEELYLSGEQRVDLMIESYRETGEVPASFVANHSLRLWALRASNWREALLAEVVAAPGKRGAPALLLTLARETSRVPAASQWRKAWENGLGVLERDSRSSADLKSMIPIAREVAQYGRD
jgi:hypothetical protein